MAFCSDIDLTIDMDRDRDGARLDVLFFSLKIAAGGVITGDVFPSTGPPRLSAVTGTCRTIPNQDISFMEMLFIWNQLNVSLVGMVYFNSAIGRAQFRGRFRAFRVVGVEGKPTASKKKAVKRATTLMLPGPPPDDGDTGTGTGQQT